MKKKLVGNQDGGYTPGREKRWREGIKFIFQQLAKKSGRDHFQILDVGCGDGSFYCFLKAEAVSRGNKSGKIKYFGFDSDPSYQQRVEEIDGRFICGDALNLVDSIGGEKFDIVIASDIIEHIDDTDKFIDQLKAATKRNGYIYLTTPNLAAWHCRLMLLFGFQPLPTEVSSVNPAFGKGVLGKKMYSGGAIHHIRVFTYKALNEFLKYHKLEVIKAFGCGYRKVDSIVFGNKFIGLSPLIVVILQNKPKNNK